MLRIALLASNLDGDAILDLRLRSRGYQTILLSEPASALGLLYSDPPDVLLVDMVAGQRDRIQTLIAQIRDDSYFSMLPVIGMIPEELVQHQEAAGLALDDFVFHPLNYPELFTRIELAARRIHRVLDNNPLTRLPGNTSIQHAIDRSIGTPVAVCYLDINNFKSYNDAYGFSRGDEVIRMVARIITNAVKEVCSSGFSGHIGGDDFVFIVDDEHADQVCRTVIENFDLIVSDLFGEEEKSAGCYLAKNRQGEVQRHPLLSVAIAAVPTAGDKILHPGQVIEIASELKHLAKSGPGSRHVYDRRQCSIGVSGSLPQSDHEPG